MEYPELRDTKKFRHSNLKQWVKSNRGNLIWAALTLCQNRIAQKRPLAKNPPCMDSFEDWIETLAGI